MKKIVIPTIITAAILLAGFVAFMPVEKASAVHTTIQNSQLALVRDTFDGSAIAIADGEEFEATSTANACLLNFLIDFVLLDAGDDLDTDGIQIDDALHGTITTAAGAEIDVVIISEAGVATRTVDLVQEAAAGVDAQFGEQICSNGEVDFILDDDEDATTAGDLIAGELTDVSGVFLTRSDATVVVQEAAAD
jgi:hypothetical protein